MFENLVSRALLILVVGVSFSAVDALSLENFIDPLLKDGGNELELDFQLSELGRVIDEAARNLFNLTLDTSTKISYANALVIIFGFSAIILAVFYLTSLAAYSIFTGMNANEGNLDLAEILSSETASNAARLFLSYINSTTTISASYALVIILGISLALLSLLGLAYAAASAIFTGTSVHSYYGKRSIPDQEGDQLDYNWARIVQILYEMDEHFRLLGSEMNQNDCRELLICQLSSEAGKDKIFDKYELQLKQLTNKLRNIYETTKIDSDLTSSLKSAYDHMKSYYEASVFGRKFGQCEISYPNCTTH